MELEEPCSKPNPMAETSDSDPWGNVETEMEGEKEPREEIGDSPAEHNETSMEHNETSMEHKETPTEHNETPTEHNETPAEPLYDPSKLPLSHLSFRDETPSPLLGSLLNEIHRMAHSPAVIASLPAIVTSFMELFENNRGIRAAVAYDLLTSLQNPEVPRENATQIIRGILLVVKDDWLLRNSVSDLAVEFVSDSVKTRSIPAIVNLTNLIGSFYQKSPDDRIVSTFLQISLVEFSGFIHLETPPSKTDRDYITAVIPVFAGIVGKMSKTHARLILSFAGLNVIWLLIPAIPVLQPEGLSGTAGILRLLYDKAEQKAGIAELLLRLSIGLMRRCEELRLEGNDTAECEAEARNVVLIVGGAHKEQFREVIRTLNEADRRILEAMLKQAAEEKKKREKKNSQNQRKEAFVPLEIDASRFDSSEM